MKILYISGDSGVEVGGRKGASTHIRETCNALVKYGHEVLLITPRAGDLSRVRARVIEVPPPAAKWIGSDMRHIVLNRRIRKEILRQIKLFQPDAMYERYSLYQTAGAVIANKLGLPRILEVNTLLAREQASRLHFPKLAEHIENALWRRERAIICVSETLKKLMTEVAGLDVQNMVGFGISPVAVDTEQFSPSVTPDPEVLAIKGNRKLAGYVGTLTAWHGVDLFFKVAHILREQGNDTIILAVGGEGERVERLRERVVAENLQDSLIFYGSIDHHRVPGFLAAMDICLIADTQDWSSPTKFFEFAAMERPIIASRSPSVEEVFGNSGTAGLYFDRGDAVGMAGQIERVQKDQELGRMIGKTARSRVLEKYTWACNVHTIMELYAKMGANGVDFPELPHSKT